MSGDDPRTADEAQVDALTASRHRTEPVVDRSGLFGQLKPPQGEPTEDEAFDAYMATHFGRAPHTSIAPPAKK